MAEIISLAARRPAPPLAARARPHDTALAAAAPRPDDGEPSPFFALVNRIMAARPDLGWGASVTCAHDIEAGTLTFGQIAAGEPITDDLLRPVLRAHDDWKAAEAAFQQALGDAARRSGRTVLALKRVLQHARKGHRVTGAPPPPVSA